MGDNELVIAMAGLISGTVIFSMIIGTIRAAFLRRPSKDNDTVLRELTALREEIRQLRQQNNDVILALDTTMHRFENRMLHADAPAVPARAAAEESPQMVGRVR